MKQRRLGTDPVKSIQGIVVPDKLPMTGKRRRRAEVLQELRLADELEVNTPASPQAANASQDAPAPVEQKAEQTTNPAPASPTAADTSPAQANEQPAGPAEESDEFVELPITAIVPGRYQPRKIFNQDRLEALADEILAANGLNNPVNVMDLGDGRYELLTGERRWRAHQLLGWETIKARVRDVSPAQAWVIALSDNTAAEPLTDFEEAAALEKSLQSGEFTSINDLSRKMGRNRGDISRLMSFFKLPEDILTHLREDPSLLNKTAAATLVSYSEDYPALVSEAFGLLRDGRLTSSSLATWLKNRARARSRRQGTRSRTVTLVGAKAGLTQAKISGQRIVLECSKSADPDSVLEALAEALGISIVDAPGAGASEGEQ